MRYGAVLFDIGGPLDLEFAWEIAVDGAIASACGLEGIRVDQAIIEEASEAAVVAFASDAYAHMIETLCGGDPQTVERVHQRHARHGRQSRCTSSSAPTSTACCAACASAG